MNEKSEKNSRGNKDNREFSSDTFELVIVQRDTKGVPVLNESGTPKTKSFSTDSPYKLWEFWQRNGQRSERRFHDKKSDKKSGKKLDKGHTAKPEEILELVNTEFAEEVQKRRRRTFDDGETS